MNEREAKYTEKVYSRQLSILNMSFEFDLGELHASVMKSGDDLGLYGQGIKRTW